MATKENSLGQAQTSNMPKRLNKIGQAQTIKIQVWLFAMVYLKI